MGILRSTSTMASRSRTAALVCLSALYGTPTVRGEILHAASRKDSTNAELLVEATKLRRVGTRTCPTFRCWVSDHATMQAMLLLLCHNGSLFPKLILLMCAAFFLFRTSLRVLLQEKL